MDILNEYGVKKPDKRFIARCIKQLKEWGAPTSGWECIDVIDVKEDDWDAPYSTCELCGCSNVRYEHVMEHQDYFETITVGCICAGIMEGDILRAKERERKMKNRAKRKKSFIERPWSKLIRNVYQRTHRGRHIRIVDHSGSFSVYVDGQVGLVYKGKPLRDFLSAQYLAFEMADPVKEVL